MTDAGLPVLHFVVAGPLRQRTGGYLYDAHMVDGLRTRSRTVQVHELPGHWPAADAVGREVFAATLQRLPDDATVLVDGLVGGAVPELLEAESARLRLILLVHHPLCDEADGTVAPQETQRLRALESRSLAAARGVIVTSAFTQRRVIQMGIPAMLVHVVEPGTARDSLPNVEHERGSRGTQVPVLLCVGSVTPRKGQLELMRALETLQDVPWRCEIAGSVERDAAYANRVHAAVAQAGLHDRVELLGELDADDLERAWERADAFVLPSRYEGYGMALAEAVARGLPVVSTTGGAIPFTVPPSVGCLVPPGDVAALAVALRKIVTDAGVRTEFAARSRAHAAALPAWEAQVERFEQAVDGLVADHTSAAGRGDTFSSDWLTLREPADHAARAERLVTTLAGAGRTRGWSRVLDLGSGRGSNLRWLNARLPWAREWVALDHDAGLLAELDSSWRGTGSLRTVCGDLAHEGIAEVARTDVVTCSALLDLVSKSWVEQLARACAARGCAALLALSWDGSATLVPVGWQSDDVADEVTRELLAAVRAHQQGEKGMGAALGPTAPAVAAAAFEAVGMRVELADAPWQLGGAALGPLLVALVEGWVDAAAEIQPHRAEAFRRWFRALRPKLEAGEVTVTVGHTDLLALPPDAAPDTSPDAAPDAAPDAVV